jgi:hypothetical protein
MVFTKLRFISEQDNHVTYHKFPEISAFFYKNFMIIEVASFYSKYTVHRAESSVRYPLPQIIRLLTYCCDLPELCSPSLTAPVDKKFLPILVHLGLRN